MKYILTHKINGKQYQINLPQEYSIDEFRKLVESGKDIMTLFNINGTYAGIESPFFLDECFISKEEEKLSNYRKILLPRSEELVSLFIQIGSIMRNAAAKKELLTDGNKIIVRTKEKEELYDFNWDYGSVLFKYLDFVQKTTLPHLALSESDTELLRKTVHAAYYIAGERGEISELFEKHYNQYFREKDN